MVEWGAERPARLDRLLSFRGWHPAIPWVLGGLGALAMFGSLVGEWQVVGPSFEFESEEGLAQSQILGISFMPVWGVGWVIGGMLLAVCGWLALAGQPPIRRYARTIGLPVAAVDLALLAGAAVDLGSKSVFGLGMDSSLELSVGRGVYAAFAGVVLIGAALYLAELRPRRLSRPAPEPAADGPADLTVGPAEPAGRPTDTLQG